MFNVIIRNGSIIDGSGSPEFKGDVAVTATRIAEVGEIKGAEADLIIDASGLVVAPGFIDMHSHSDFTLPVYPTANSLLHQGITTAVIGQCGLSPAPLRKETRREVTTYLDAFRGSFGTPSLPWEKWGSFHDYLSFLSGTGISLNVAPLVGHGVIRAAVMGFDTGPANHDQLVRMQEELSQSMEQGALGISTGLIYPPGSYASTDELIELFRPLKQLGGIYFSHIRGEAGTLLQAISEAIAIARETGVALEISHFKAARRNNWEKAGKALEMIDRAQAEGLDVTADMYPYVAGSTALVAFLPEWAQEGGKQAILKRLMDETTRQKMVSSMKSEGYSREVEWDGVMISGSPKNPLYEGQFISTLAARSNQSPHEWIFDALHETDLNMGMVIFSISEDNVKLQMTHSAMMIGTDGTGLMHCGSMASKAPHPRCYGTFPRVLGNYVRNEKVISLKEAIFKMTAYPAKKLGIRDRGTIKKGFQADLVIFDPATIIDKATYEKPDQDPIGVFHVFVNGQLVIHNGQHTGSRPGMILTR